MRGFKRRQLGPLDDEGAPIGGEALVQSSAEFRFPLFGAYLRALNAVPVDRDGAGAKGLKMILDRLFPGERL